MTERNDGGPAFARPFTDAGSFGMSAAQPGMSLRDWFAGQALPGLVAGAHDIKLTGTAAAAYRVADAMIQERDKS